MMAFRLLIEQANKLTKRFQKNLLSIENFVNNECVNFNSWHIYTDDTGATEVAKINIIFFGHSINRIDWPVLAKYIKCININSIIVYYYSLENKISLLKNLQQLFDYINKGVENKKQYDFDDLLLNNVVFFKDIKNTNENDYFNF